MPASLELLDASSVIGRPRSTGGYKTVLVQAGDGPSARGRMAVAAALGRRFEAQVTGVAALPFDVMNDPAFGYLSAAALAEAERLHQQALINAVQAFDEVVGARVACRAVNGFPTQALVAGARRADLVVTSRAERHAHARDAVDVAELVMKLGEPLLLLPPSTDTLDLQSVVIGWKDTRECRRAVADALPFLIAAERVALVAVADDEDRATTAVELEDMAARLAGHGVTASTQVIAPQGENVLKQLVDAADARGAELLVLGAYGRSRAREWLFGGVTTEALEGCGKALLLSH